MKKIFLLYCMLVSCTWCFAQTPKWIEKAKNAVFSIISYDAEDNILHSGNGFFINEGGEALSDYAVFEGAQKAVVITPDGNKQEVSTIIGANEMYDIVHFKVKLSINPKKLVSLPVYTEKAAENTKIYLLPYSTQKDRSFTSGQIKQIDPLNTDYAYYTLNLALQEKMVSCPIVNEEGAVIGLAQKSSGKDTLSICYAVDARFAQSLSMNALSFSNPSLQKIGIKKELPANEEEALTYLYMASSLTTPEKYMEMLDDFINKFPNNMDGYFRRATQHLYTSQTDESMALVEEDLDKGLSCAEKKDEAYFNRAKTIYTYVQTGVEKTYKGWSYDTAINEINKAIKITDQPVYTQLLAELQYAKGDYAASLASYEIVNRSEIASTSTLYNILKVSEALEKPVDELLVLADSCIAKFTPPYTSVAAPFLLERAQLRMQKGLGRQAFLDYNEYEKAVNGQVNDLFFYYRSQAALLGRQYQNAINDIDRAITMNPNATDYLIQSALINLRVARNEDAIKNAQDVLAKDANNAEAYRLLGLAHLQLKHQKEACEFLQKAKDLGDEQADSLLQKYCK